MRPVFIGGCSRSGTTLLAAMLGTHDQCLTTPESKFVFWVYHACIQDYGYADMQTALTRIKTHWSFKVFGIDIDGAAADLEPNTAYPEVIKWIVKRYGHHVGKATPGIWVDHFPDNITYAATLFELFPDAKLIHLLRDGRAVAASVMKLGWGPNTVNRAARWWADRIAHGLAAESFFGPERIKRIRYEDLILEPHETLKEVCAFLQIEYQPKIIRGTGFQVPEYSQEQHALVGHKLEVERVQAWQRELSPRQIEIFESIAGNILHCMEYDLMYGLRARGMTRLERVIAGAKELYRRQIANRFHRRRRIRRAVSGIRRDKQDTRAFVKKIVGWLRVWVICTLAVLLITNVSCGFRHTRSNDAGAIREQEVGEVGNEQAQPTGTGEQNRRPTETAEEERTQSVATIAPVEQTLLELEVNAGKDGHPRLFFDASDIPKLQASATTTHREIAKPIRNYITSELGTDPRTTLFSRRKLETYRGFGNRLISFAFACVITQEASHCDLAKTYLLAFATWDQWGEDNVRDLGLAHMLLGNAIAYDWLYSTLTPSEQQTVRESLGDWAQKMYEASVASERVEPWNNWWRKSYAQNHYSTANSALGMAGLALLGEDERAQTWVSHAAERMSRVQYLLNGIEDGTWHEGMGYQGYLLTMSLPFMVNLRKIVGTDILPHDYLRHYPYWRIYNHLPSSCQFVMTFGNVDWRFLGPKTQNVLRFTASEYDDGHAEWMAQQLIAGGARSADARSSAWNVFEFLYYDPLVQPEPPTDLDKARVFPDLEGIIWRTGWEVNDLVFGLKTGAYGGRYAFDTFTQEVYPWETPCQETRCQLNMGHDHADANTFYIHRAGAWLAPENAEYGYSATEFHNTLLIDDQGQYKPERTARRNPLHFVDGDGYMEATANTLNFDYVAADATRPYRTIKGLRDFTRHVVFVRPSYLVMLDNLDADAAHQYEWTSHFGANVAIEDDWIRGSATGGQVLGILVAAPRPFEATIGNDGLSYVRIRPPSPVADVRFIHILYPTEQTSWHTRPGVTILDDTGQAAAVRVGMNDGSGRTDDILLTYGQPGPAITVGPYSYDGQVGVVSRGADGQLEKLFVYGGTFLQDLERGQALVTNLDRNLSFEAVYVDQSVAVSGNIQTEITLYAPWVEELTVNGQPWPFTQFNEYITLGVQ